MDTFCFKALTIDNYQEIIHDFVNNTSYDSFENNFNYIDVKSVLEKSPSFKKWLEESYCVLSKAAIIVSTIKSSIGEPHIDSQVNSLALNFPLSNCEHSYTAFYDPADINSIIDEEKPNGVLYKKIIFKKAPREISRYVLDRPILLNTHVPHKIFHGFKKPRYAISFRFVDDPWHLVG
jgi:hypothetical protein